MRTGPSGNCARFAAKPLTHGGTPVPLWLADLDREPLPPLDLSGCKRLIVVAPHPDDETLGLGATTAQLVASGVDVQVVSVSDGGAAKPGATLSGRLRLATIRRHELHRATGVLGVSRPVTLGLPDGELADHEGKLAELLVEILEAAGPMTWCAATGAALLEYPVWMWHWASPADPAVPWDRAHSVRVSGWAIDRKRLAAQRYRSQFAPSAGESAPVLPAFVLQRLLAVGEVVFR